MIGAHPADERAMQDLGNYPHIRQSAIRSLFEIFEQSSEGTIIVDRDALSLIHI